MTNQTIAILELGISDCASSRGTTCEECKDLHSCFVLDVYGSNVKALFRRLHKEERLRVIVREHTNEVAL
jgi:hypothetical protein